MSTVGFGPAGRVGAIARRCTESGSTSGSTSSHPYSDTTTDMDYKNIFSCDDEHFQAGPLPAVCLRLCLQVHHHAVEQLLQTTAQELHLTLRNITTLWNINHFYSRQRRARHA